MYLERKEKYADLGKELDGVVVSYITSDRPGFETQIAQDVIDLFIDQLDKIGVVKRIILYLYTRGGDTAAAWNIVNLLRMYCDELVVVVPHKAHSAGTMICLGANKIIMTKQATLGPIDPSLNTPLNPKNPLRQNLTMPVSVEAVKGYVNFAKDELGIKDGKSLSNIMEKLSEYIHPLVLGQVFRSRAQIQMLAKKLLVNQVENRKSVKAIIEFLCSESGSHDYTINRREAKEMSLKVEKPTDEQYKLIKSIYDDISLELEFKKTFNPGGVGTYTIRRGLIESIVGGSDYFVTEGRIVSATTKEGGNVLNNQILYEGWRHEEPLTDTKTVNIIGKGDVVVEKDDGFYL